MIINMPYYVITYVAVKWTILPLTYVDLVVVLHAYQYVRYVTRDMPQKFIQMIAVERALFPLADQIQRLVLQLRSHFTLLPTAFRDGVEF